MIPRRNIPVLTLFCVCLVFTAPSFLDAQSTKPQNAQEAKLSKKYWELWRTGFESYEAGESALLAGRNEEAADYYRKAVKAFQSVKANNPNWNKNVIDYRISLAGRRLRTALRRMEYRNMEQKTDADALLNEASKSPSAQLSALRDSLAESERQNAELRKAAEQGKLARDQVSGLLADKKAIDTKYASLLLQYNELKKKADSAAEGSSVIEKTLRTEQLRTSALVKVVNELRSENVKLQEMIRDFRANLDDAKKKLTEAEKNSAASQKMEQLLGDVQAKYAAMEKTSAERNAKFEAELKDLRAKLAAKTAECDELRKSGPDTVKKISAEADALRKQIDGIKAANEALKKDILARDAKIIAASDKDLRNDSMISSLNSTNGTLTAENAKLKSELQKQTEAAAKNQALVEATRKNNERLQAELKLLAERVNKLPVDTASADAEKVKNELERKKLSEKLTALQTELTSVRKEFARAQALLAEGANKDKQLTELQTALKTAQAQLETLRKTPAKTVVKTVESPADAELRKKVQTLQAEIDSLKKTPAKTVVQKVESPADAGLQEKIKTLEAEIDTLKKTPAKTIVQKVESPADAGLQEKIKTLEAETARLTQEQKKALAEQTELQKKYEAAQAELQKKIQTAQAEMSATETKNKELTDANNALTESIKKAAEEKNKFTERNEKLAKDLLNTQALLEKARLEAQDDSKIRAAEKERDLWKDKYEQGEASRKDLEKNLSGRETENQALQTKIAQVETDRDAVLKKSQKLEAQLENWKKGGNTVTKEDLAVKETAIDSLTKDLRKQGDEFNKMKTKLMEAEAETARYRKNLQLARDVTEEAMAESRKLRAELALLRRANPDAAVAVIKQAQGMPQEIKVLTEEENSASKRASSADMTKYATLMKAAKEAEDKKNFDDALWQYWAAADAGVTQPDPYIAISRIHAVRNNPEQGIKTYERALRLGAKRVPEIENTLKKQLIEKQKEKK